MKFCYMCSTGVLKKKNITILHTDRHLLVCLLKSQTISDTLKFSMLPGSYVSWHVF